METDILGHTRAGWDQEAERRRVLLGGRAFHDEWEGSSISIASEGRELEEGAHVQGSQTP